MENLDAGNMEPLKVDDLEICFSCGKEIKEGQGRFRKPKGVFCIDCYPDADLGASSATSFSPLNVN